MIQYTNKYDAWYKVAFMIENLAMLTSSYRVDRLVRLDGIWHVQVTYG